MKYTFFLFLIFLTSCIYGLKTPKKLSVLEVQKAARDFKIDSFICLEDNLYHDFWANVSDTQAYKNHYQPLQIYYYEDNNLVSYHINCLASGFPNLNWNKNKNLNTFPPKSQAPIDSFLDLSTHLAFANKKSPNTYKYTVLIYWNRFMGRQTKVFLKAFRQNLALSKLPVQVYFINNDNWFAE
jgi:hypothetical protein